MAKELLLYSGIYNFVAENLIKAMEEYKSGRINIRINSGGGDLQASVGIAAKMKEHGDVHILVDAAAMSAAFNLCLYAKTVECLDITNFMAHRAAYSYGGDSQAEKEYLAKVNADLRKQMELRIDSAKLKEMKGVTIADIFEKEERIAVFFNAAEAKQLGIVSKVNKLTPEEVEAFNETFLRIAAEHNPTENSKPTTMTRAELKEKFPAVYNEIFADGVAAENDRIGAAMVFAHLDPEGVKAIIKSGKAMTATQQAEFALKAMSPDNLKKIQADAAAAVVTTEVVATKGENKELTSFEKDVRAQMGLDKSKDTKEVSLVQDVK